MSSINPELIVIIAIFGAGAAVTIGFVVARMFGFTEEPGIQPIGQEQNLYMRQVRTRNHAQMYWQSVEAARVSRAETEQTNL
ncbi:hypothetical protein BGW36DRAFT_18835 [Talaromyces proteolyticus]|uniref:Uncharacterized protein n=1 Tax=Talaromyces proteolyticus TaxID=1131652 RepID=A0AAD4L296_9EURO|nr:uncharacterized protein BGW36DRAFT_18835 [Talaromyces proteolyticus]KAH8705854.1 hypothetical protein BGW36DRAFT_18835 [Talaromyces proteolyticus]